MACSESGFALALSVALTYHTWLVSSGDGIQTPSLSLRHCTGLTSTESPTACENPKSMGIFFCEKCRLQQMKYALDTHLAIREKWLDLKYDWPRPIPICCCLSMTFFLIEFPSPMMLLLETWVLFWGFPAKEGCAVYYRVCCDVSTFLCLQSLSLSSDHGIRVKWCSIPFSKDLSLAISFHACCFPISCRFHQDGRSLRNLAGKITRILPLEDGTFSRFLLALSPSILKSSVFQLESILINNKNTTDHRLTALLEVGQVVEN